MGCSQSAANFDSSTHFDKILVTKPEKILIIGDSRIKIATAVFLKSKGVDVVVGTSSLKGSRNAPLIRMNVDMVFAEMSDPQTIKNVMIYFVLYIHT